MGDEQVGQAELALQILQQVDDLRLHRDVERGDRLVADDEAAVAAPGRGRCRCAGAGRRRIRAGSGRRERRGQADQLQHLGRPASRARGIGARAVDQQRLHDDVLDRHARVERAERVLEDDLHGAGAARAAPVPFRPVMSAPSKMTLPP